MPQVNLTFEQIEEAVEHLAPKERLGLAKKLGREFLKMRWDALFEKIKKRTAQHSMSEEQISKMIEQAREEFYLAQKTRRRH